MGSSATNLPLLVSRKCPHNSCTRYSKSEHSRQLNLGAFDPKTKGNSKVSYIPSLDDYVTLDQSPLVPKLEAVTCNSMDAARG